MVRCGQDLEDESCNESVVTYASDLLPMVVEPYCLQCHSDFVRGTNRRGAPDDLNFDDRESVSSNAERIANAITSGLMPPSDQPRPSPELRELAVSWRRCGFQF